MLPLDCITEHNLRMLAGERWFARGEATFLENMDHQQLVELVLSAASNNRRLRDKLEFAKAAAGGPDLSIFRKAITDATRTAGIDY